MDLPYSRGYYSHFSEFLFPVHNFPSEQATTSSPFDKPLTNGNQSILSVSNGNVMDYLYLILVERQATGLSALSHLSLDMSQ